MVLSRNDLLMQQRRRLPKLYILVSGDEELAPSTGQRLRAGHDRSVLGLAGRAGAAALEQAVAPGGGVDGA